MLEKGHARGGQRTLRIMKQASHTQAESIRSTKPIRRGNDEPHRAYSRFHQSEATTKTTNDR